jgi:hypothetical protein
VTYILKEDSLLIASRRFFPPTSTEAEPESEWEEVEGGESADNGPVADGIKLELPNVPKDEPVNEGPSPKKSKPNDPEEL